MSTLWRGEFWSDGHEMETVGVGRNERVIELFVLEKDTPREEHCRLILLYIPWSSHGIFIDPSCGRVLFDH
jgi:hypothetical protein